MNYLSKNEVSTQLSSSKFLEATINQIQKDFHQFTGELIEFEQTSTYDEICTRIQSSLNTIKENSTFQALIYQIDIPESAFVEAASRNDLNYFLAELILRREAMKVFLRNKYSQH